MALGKYYPGCRMSRADPIGFEIVKGKRKIKYEYNTYIPTKEGEFKLSVWIQKAREEMYECGLGELYERVKDYCREYKWLKKEEDLEDWALRAMYYEAYMHWKGFTIIWA